MLDVQDITELISMVVCSEMLPGNDVIYGSTPPSRLRPRERVRVVMEVPPPLCLNVSELTKLAGSRAPQHALSKLLDDRTVQRMMYSSSGYVTEPS